MAINQIIVRGKPEIKEGVATETITPGDLLDFVAGSAATPSTSYLTPYVKKHAIAGFRASKMIALEQDYIGRLGGGSTTLPIDKTYANLDQVRYGIFRAGDEAYMRLKASENVSYGNYLESNGDGTLRINSGGSPGNDNRLVGRALGVSNSASIARIVVEVL
jgi:hypothetical protein